MRRLAATLGAALAFGSCAGSVLAQGVGKNIFVSIHNPHHEARDVLVVDNVSERVLFDGRLAGHGTQPVELYTRNRNRGDVSITDVRTGKRRDYGDVLHGDRLEAP